MELDLSGHRSLLFSLLVLLLLLGLGWLGYAYLPSGDRLLTRTEWQFLKASLAYRKELSRLQVAAESLADLVNDRPDPVRALLLAESIQHLTSQGQPALGYQRGKVMTAAQAVSDWAMGAIEHEAARQALEEALQALLPGQYPLPTLLSENNPDPAIRKR